MIFFTDVVLDSLRLAVHMPGIKRIRELIIYFMHIIYPDISLLAVQPVSIVGDMWRKDVCNDLSVHTLLNVNIHAVSCVGLSTLTDYAAV